MKIHTIRFRVHYEKNTIRYSIIVHRACASQSHTLAFGAGGQTVQTPILLNKIYM